LFKDPVCGMEIVASNAAGTSEAAGKTWHFCSESCKYQFDAAPEKFIGQGAAPVQIGGVVRGLSTKEATDGSHHSRTNSRWFGGAGGSSDYGDDLCRMR